MCAPKETSCRKTDFCRVTNKEPNDNLIIKERTRSRIAHESDSYTYRVQFLPPKKLKSPTFVKLFPPTFVQTMQTKNLAA